jgi:hypothetical protein
MAELKSLHPLMNKIRTSSDNGMNSFRSWFWGGVNIFAFFEQKWQTVKGGLGYNTIQPQLSVPLSVCY